MYRFRCLLFFEYIWLALLRMQPLREKARPLVLSRSFIIDRYFYLSLSRFIVSYLERLDGALRRAHNIRDSCTQ